SGHGRVGGEPARRFTTLFIDHGETAAFTAEQEMELLHLGLPDLRGLAAAQPEALPAEAAEEPCPARSAARSDALQTRDPGYFLSSKPGSRISSAPLPRSAASGTRNYCHARLSTVFS